MFGRCAARAQVSEGEGLVDTLVRAVPCYRLQDGGGGRGQIVYYWVAVECPLSRSQGQSLGELVMRGLSSLFV